MMIILRGLGGLINDIFVASAAVTAGVLGGESALKD